MKKGSIHSPESLTKMAQSHKGHITWNKGKKGVQMAWNKGKTYGEETRKKIGIASRISAQKRREAGLSNGIPVGFKFPKNPLKPRNSWKKGVPIPSKQGVPHSIEHRLKASASMKRRVALGIHNTYRGKISKENLLRESLDYKLWREAIYQRDNYSCQECGKRGVKLNADHIKPWSLFPELRFELSNGRTLCVPCHRKTDTWGMRGKTREILSHKRTALIMETKANAGHAW